MSEKNKELLLRDLCARLPYGVKAHIRYWSNWSNQYCEGVFTIESVNPSTKYLHASSEQCFTEGTVGQDCDFVIEPYLFPMSSMTEEQRKEFIQCAGYEAREEENGYHYETYYYDLVGNENVMYPDCDGFDWLNKNHFDYRGLIEKSLALDATGLNIY